MLVVKYTFSLVKQYALVLVLNTLLHDLQRLSFHFCKHTSGKILRGFKLTV